MTSSGHNLLDELFLIDLHCHLLPGLDDGAQNSEVTSSIILSAMTQGVGSIVCTPHCISGDPNLPGRIVRILELVSFIQDVLERAKLPLHIYPGMELLCNSHLPRTLCRGEVLTLAASRYLLIEFPFGVSCRQIDWAIGEVRQAGYSPVLAHPERYPSIWEQKDSVANWFFEGVVIQLDQDSVLGRFGRQTARTAAWILRHGLAHVVSSDAHSLHSRAISLDILFQQIAKDYSQQYAELLLHDNPTRILRNQHMIQPEAKLESTDP